jgi:tricarballylate dehydrogenase
VSRASIDPASEPADVVVVGGGNAGFCAAHAAAEAGARVLLLEKASADAAGGNSYYTAGAFRVAHGGLDDLRPLIDDELTTQRLPHTELAPYSDQEFIEDLARVTGGRGDQAMAQLVASHSAETMRWLADKGLRFRLIYERQAYFSSGAWVFFGNLALGTVDGGRGLIAQHTAAAAAAGVRVRYDAAVVELLVEDDTICGARYRDAHGALRRVDAGAVVLAAGGFEANPQLRREHLGADWAHAAVRGTPTNTGEVLGLALAAGAARHGDWSSCHSVAWDADAPPGGGDRVRTNQLTRQSYPIGIVVNRDGERFLDEGADFRNYTYAKYGKEILAQPGHIAFQLFDAKTRPLLRGEEYDSQPIAGAQADDLGELAQALAINGDRLRRTVTEFNASIVDRPFNPAIKDGRAARVTPPKSHWAQPLDTPPFYGYTVTCGITFTFGGIRVNRHAAVLRPDGIPIPGLYAAGELVGGLFSGNYPGGSGLTAGSVYGRLAGSAAARTAPGPR